MTEPLQPFNDVNEEVNERCDHTFVLQMSGAKHRGHKAVIVNPFCLLIGRAKVAYPGSVSVNV